MRREAPRPAPGRRVLALNKPMNTLSQFTPEGRWPGLAGLGLPEGVYAAGRLDRDSEGLLILTDDGRLQARLTDPRRATPKTYYALVEGTPDAAALDALRRGVTLRDGRTRPAEVEAVGEPGWLWPRDPPVRHRLTVPDAWLRLTLTEGRNRQVRRMCAHVGLPVLRLIRWSVGGWTVEGLGPGAWRAL
jgi:23S rRNA pseudouridine2457 synthase